MPHDASKNLNARVAAAVCEALAVHLLAKRFGVRVSTAGEWFRRRQHDDEPTKCQECQRPVSNLSNHEIFILDLIVKRPDLSLAEIAQRLAAKAIYSRAISRNMRPEIKSREPAANDNKASRLWYLQ